jgi:predicted MFS family arabinose efflux permease
VREHGETRTLRGWASALVRFPLPLLLSVYFLSISSFTAMTAVLALYLDRRFGLGAEAMGVVFAIAGASTVLVRGVLLGPLVRRLGEAGTVRLGTVMLSLSLVSIPFLPHPYWLGIVVPLWAFSTGTLFPSLASLVSRATAAGAQGSVLGGSQLVGGLGRVLGPIWAGLLFQHVTIASPFTVGAIVVALAAFTATRIPAPSKPASERLGAAEARDVGD